MRRALNPRSPVCSTISAVKKGYIKEKDDNLSGSDVREGLTAVISVKLTEAQFEGQTKAKLGNTEIRGLVSGIVYDKLKEFFEENPAVAKAIYEKAMQAAVPARPPKSARAGAPQVCAGKQPYARQAGGLP